MSEAPIDPRPLLLNAVDQVVGLVRAVRPAQLDGPTPCPEFDVRALCGHLLSVLRRVTAVGRAEDPLVIPSVAVVPDGELSGAVAAQAEELAAAWSDDAVLDRVVALPFGTMPGRAAAVAYTQELTTHAWDLARAVGATAALRPDLAVAILPLARQFVPAEVRGGPVPFGPVVPVDPDAEPYAQLAAWLGRDPAWTPAVSAAPGT